jgi:hypothetical protein
VRVRVGIWSVVAALVAVSLIFREHELSPTESDSATDRRAGDAVDAPGDTFVYDVATRFNETLVASIDAIDTALTAVLAGDVAIAVFAIDKIRELQAVEERCAISLLCGSVLSCAVGYVVGFSVSFSGRDGVPPRSLIADLCARPGNAMSEAVESVIDAGEINLNVRFLKRAFAVAAILMLLLGGALVALARLTGDVVK